MTSFPSAASPFNLPGGVERFLRDRQTPAVSLRDRMQLVIRLALWNVEQGPGGPFGAAVFESDTGALVSVGVNLVTVTNCSHAHAEMVALANAQQQVRSFDLGTPGLPPYELVTSCEPCAMCFGAIPLSGVRSLVCGARSEDAEAFGFDEGAKAKNWVTALEERGIAVARDVCRDEAMVVFEEYRKRGGLIYNPRRGR
ncbi:nucleoside deaminase [Nitrospira sp. NS4]|uniref:nucleoside deaminase n=1 Tax=Nitrospira sp. NS4 TaxID=3414498 RepID=UPI003C2FBDF0